MQSLKHLYKMGPGPSSSHTIGPKIACKKFIKEFGAADKYTVTLYGSLALTAKGHGTDFIIEDTLGKGKVEIKYVDEALPRHPNAMDILNDRGDKFRVYSIGGGTVEIEGYEHWLEKIYPLDTWDETMAEIKKQDITLVEYIMQFEDESIWKHLEEVGKTFLSSIKEGLEEKEGLLVDDKGFKAYKKARILFEASKKEEDAAVKSRLEVAAYAHAVSEGSAMGKEIVTSPTCGSCGVVPAVYKYALDKYKPSKQTALEALMIAGYIGNLIKARASISGAEGGCQAEIGSSSSMAAAMLAHIKGFKINVVEYAALSAMEHSLGLTCDPIGGYVIVPCIERNAVYANKSIDVVAMANIVADKAVLTLDKVIKTMKETGDDMMEEYRETSKGGLAVCWE